MGDEGMPRRLDGSPPRLVSADTLDWAVFADTFWDRQPVLFKAVAVPPFEESEVFDAAVLGTHPAHPLAIPSNTQFTIERWQQTEPRDYLPSALDGSLKGYQERIAELLNGRRYALVINLFHTFHYPQWARERAFYAGLWEHVGQPLSGAITTMFHGTYEHSPVGVHKDRFATFMFCLRGRKRMRFWSQRPWQEPVSTVLDYRQYLESSFTAEVGPGDLLYWPSRYFHVGESVGDEPATSVNVGVPREGHRAAYDLGDLLADAIGSSGQRRAVAAPTFTEHTGLDSPLPDTLPPAFEQALEIVREYGHAQWLRDRIVDLTLQHQTAGGFRPVPPPAPRRPLADDDVIRATAPIVAAQSGEICLYAANGNVARVVADPDELSRTFGPLRSGRATRVGELVGECEEMRRLLETLESFHALSRDASCL
jgi:50S ribosomal protein L16 3-hydroxylase